MENIKELKNEIYTWWKNLKYLQKLEILNEIYGLSITSIELQGVGNLWRTAGSLEKKKLIMDQFLKEQKKERG